MLLWYPIHKIITKKNYATCTILILGIAMNGSVGDLYEKDTLLYIQ